MKGALLALFVLMSSIGMGSAAWAKAKTVCVHANPKDGDYYCSTSDSDQTNACAASAGSKCKKEIADPSWGSWSGGNHEEECDSCCRDATDTSCHGFFGKGQAGLFYKNCMKACDPYFTGR